MATELLHRVFQKRAKHPVVYGTVDVALSGGALGLATTDAAYNFLNYSHNLQAEYGFHFTPAPSQTDINSGLCIDAIITASLYFVYYFTGFRVLNPFQWRKANRSSHPQR